MVGTYLCIYIQPVFLSRLVVDLQEFAHIYGHIYIYIHEYAYIGSEQVSQAALPSNVETSNQAINLESKSVHKSKRPFNINDILNVKLRSQAAPPSTITSNQLNGISSKSIQADNKKPFNINDILNVKLRSRTNELSNSSTDHKKPSVIKVKRKTPIAKISGSIHNRLFYRWAILLYL
jgi:flagellar basal body L-ring protein FlgH